MGKIAGRLSTLSISADSGATYNALGSLRDGTFNVEKAEIGSTTRDDGAWEDFIEGRKSATIDASCAWDESDAQLMAIIDAFYADTTLMYKWTMSTLAGLKEHEANGIVLSVPESGPNDDLGTVDISIRVKGTVTNAIQS